MNAVIDIARAMRPDSDDGLGNIGVERDRMAVEVAVPKTESHGRVSNFHGRDRKISRADGAAHAAVFQATAGLVMDRVLVHGGSVVTGVVAGMVRGMFAMRGMIAMTDGFIRVLVRMRDRSRRDCTGAGAHGRAVENERGRDQKNEQATKTHKMISTRLRFGRLGLQTRLTMFFPHKLNADAGLPCIAAVA